MVRPVYHRARRDALVSRDDSEGKPPCVGASGRCSNLDSPATDYEIRAACRQFVRKLSGFHAPSRANAAAFERGVDEVEAAARRLVAALRTSAPPRDRAIVAARARERARLRFPPA